VRKSSISLSTLSPYLPPHPLTPRRYDNETLKEDALAVEEMLLDDLDPNSAEGVHYRRERSMGMGVGGGSMDDGKVIDILDGNPFEMGDGVIYKKEAPVRKKGGGRRGHSKQRKKRPPTGQQQEGVT
jgi:hypothetical protein